MNQKIVSVYLFIACGNGKCFEFIAANVEQHYRDGSGQLIQGNLSEIQGLLDKTAGTWKATEGRPGLYAVGTFGVDGFSSSSQGRALGQILALDNGDGSFRTLFDEYNFEQRKDLNPTTIGRNAITAAASRYVGSGREFRIYFGGSYTPPVIQPSRHGVSP